MIAYPLSPSALNTFLWCPYAWFVKKVLGLDSGSSMFAAVGRMWHKVLELYVAYLLAEGIGSDMLMLRKIYNEVITQYGPMDFEYAEDFYDTIASKCYLEPGSLVGQELRIALNHRLEVVPYFLENGKADNTVMCRGIIDIVTKVDDERIKIRDYKVTWKLGYDSGIQLEMYAMMALAKYPWAQYVDVELWLIGRNIVTPSKAYSREQLPDFHRKYLNYYKIIENAIDFPKTPNPNTCVYCPVLEDCAEACGLMEDIADYESLCRAYTVHKAAADRLKSRLAVALNARADAGDLTYVTSQKRVITDKPAAIAAVLKYADKDEIANILSISVGDAAKLAYTKEFIGASETKEFEKTIREILK